MVVLEDADLDLTAQGVVNLLISLNSQWCRALGRLIVHERIADDLLGRALDRLSRVRLGDSLSPESDIGPPDSLTAQGEGRVAAPCVD